MTYRKALENFDSRTLVWSDTWHDGDLHAYHVTHEGEQAFVIFQTFPMGGSHEGWEMYIQAGTSTTKIAETIRLAKEMIKISAMKPEPKGPGVDAKKRLQLALEFSRLLGDELTANEMAAVRELNLKQTSDLICHTHDFTDSNMVMDKAMRNIGITPVLAMDVESNPDLHGKHVAQVALWNSAWDLAKGHGFAIEEADYTEIG